MVPVVAARPVAMTTDTETTGNTDSPEHLPVHVWVAPQGSNCGPPRMSKRPRRPPMCDTAQRTSDTPTAAK